MAKTVGVERTTWASGECSDTALGTGDDGSLGGIGGMLRAMLQKVHGVSSSEAILYHIGILSADDGPPCSIR